MGQAAGLPPLWRFKSRRDAGRITPSSRPLWESALGEWNVRESVVLTRFINEGRDSAIVTVLEERFGSLPEEVTKAIGACAEFAKLQEWLTAAVRAESLDAFRALAGV